MTPFHVVGVNIFGDLLEYISESKTRIFDVICTPRNNHVKDVKISGHRIKKYMWYPSLNSIRNRYFTTLQMITNKEIQTALVMSTPHVASAKFSCLVLVLVENNLRRKQKCTLETHFPPVLAVSWKVHAAGSLTLRLPATIHGSVKPSFASIHIKEKSITTCLQIQSNCVPPLMHCLDW